ncbi:TRAP transporter large permease [Acrocarpospora pleiomorpha]|nr:TRAP transporter large permease subunit [Acrocarpospora pleiomorpha]
MFAATAPSTVGYAALAMVLVLMFMRVPIAVSMAVPSLIGLYALRGELAVESALATVPFSATAQWTLTVLPMFVFMGVLLEMSGITATIYRAASAWLNWMPGGVGVATNVAGAGLSSISGSSLGTTYALGRAGIPEMLDRGYDRRLAVGAVGVSSLAGHLIPPSMMLVIYAGIAEVPIGPQLLAGVMPGLLIVACSCALIVLLGLLRPELVGSGKASRSVARVTWRERWISLARVWPVPVLVVVVLGGMLAGAFTATEAAAGGAVGAVLLTTLMRRKDKPLTVLRESAGKTVEAIGSIFLLVIGAVLMTRFLAITGITGAFTDWVADSGMSRTAFLLILVVVYVILGTFLESMTMMLLVVPFLIPTLHMLEVDMLWFGVFTVLLAEVGLLHPPLGILSYIIHGLAQDPRVNRGVRITLGDVFVSILWFIPAIAVTLALLMAFPEIVTWLPGLSE